MSSAQFNGEYPGPSVIFLRGLGMDVADVIGAASEFGGGTRFVGPRFGRGPVEGTRKADVLEVGGWRLPEATALRGRGNRGGGINTASGDGTTRGAEKEGGLCDGPEARWAEFSAGNEGGGICASSSEEESWLSSVKDGIEAFGDAAVAFGVPSGLTGGFTIPEVRSPSSSSCICGDAISFFADGSCLFTSLSLLPPAMGRLTIHDRVQDAGGCLYAMNEAKTSSSDSPTIMLLIDG